MFTYKKYCYDNGKLTYMISSEENFDTREQAIIGAREAAKVNIPMLCHGAEFKETENGAETWYRTPNCICVHVKYVVD